MLIRNLILQALKDKAPSTFRSLQSSGKLRQYVSDLDEQVSSQVVQMNMADAQRLGWNKLGPMERAKLLKAAHAQNLEIVLHDLLEFLPDETSLQSQD
ncbi:hypothetical protein THICB3320147 [Thiomonas sp. CB3]|nr:hypothetical protein THICB3320147 [Thiomonas sp. CB3]